MPGGVLGFECDGADRYYQREGAFWRQRLIRIFHVSNTDPSGSRVPNSGLSNENVFLKGAGHQRRLCSVDPQLQQRPLYCTQAWRRASSVFKMLFVTVHTIS